MEEIKTGDKMCAGKGCKCPHHKIGAWLLLVLGIVFLLQACGVVTWGFVNVTWPTLLIIFAIGKMCKCCGGHHCKGGVCEKPADQVAK
jgi:hypothetical protein